MKTQTRQFPKKNVYEKVNEVILFYYCFDESLPLFVSGKMFSEILASLTLTRCCYTKARKT